MEPIDRQAAIDTIKDADVCVCYSENESVEIENIIDLAIRATKRSVIASIEQMPSAQPEIVRCGQCKYAEVADKEDAQDGYTCQFHRGSVWFSGSYCSWAQRRTDGTAD